MQERPTWSVLPRQKGGWAVQRDGAARAMSVHRERRAAVACAVALARRSRGEVHIVGPDGRIEDARSYGGA